jgi:protein involved in polysaccharide export with SLBB domain
MLARLALPSFSLLVMECPPLSSEGASLNTSMEAWQGMARSKIAVAVLLLASVVGFGVNVGVCEAPAKGKDKASSARSSYIIEAPDILRIQVSDKLLPAARGINGEYLVRPDGTIGLGTCGNAFVAGLTVEQVPIVIARRLKPAGVAKHLGVKEIARELKVEVVAYDSKVYYVIANLPGREEHVYRFPSRGNETVLDALSRVEGLPAVASKCGIYVVRQVTQGNLSQVLPVDWKGITQRGASSTNYALQAGDRIYVCAGGLQAVEGRCAKVEKESPRLSGMLSRAFGDSSEALRATIKLEVRSLGLVLAANEMSIEPDGRARFTPCWLARFSEAGEEAQPVVAIRCPEARVSFDGPVKSLADIGRRRITDVDASSDVGMTFPKTANRQR